MAINRVEIKDFLVFKGEFAADFCPGVNVFIGGNGTGKTTLMKVMYRLCGNGKPRHTYEYFYSVGCPEFYAYDQPFEYLRMKTLIGDTESRICVRVDRTCGSPDGDNANIYVDNVFRPYEPASYIDDYTNSTMRYFEGTEAVFTSDNYKPFPSVYIPATNLLPNAYGLSQMIDDYEMDFDATQVDALKNAQRPGTRALQPNCKKLIGILSDIIDGEVLYDDGRFYIMKNSGRKVQFSIEASGVVRLGLLWKLFRNGLLEDGKILFWDEPENSLNPEQIPILVDILLELSRNGVQVFLATHSEIMASYFSVNRKRSDAVMFHSLYRDSEIIRVESGDRFDLLDNNKLSSEPVKLYKKQLERGLSGNG